jgi:hypothetical protein
MQSDGFEEVMDMLRKMALLFIVLFAVTTASAAYAADISRLGGGARSISLGKAYSGQLGDPNSMFVNPSGIAAVNTFEISSMYVNFAGDISYAMLSAAYPTAFGVVGVGYMGAFSGDLPFTTQESTGRIGSAGVFNYSSNIMSVSYAGNPSDKLSLGLSGKYFFRGSPQVDGGSGSGMSIDMGAVYRMNDKVKIGLSGQNLINTGIKWDGGVTEAIPYDLKAGLVVSPNEKLSAMLDVHKSQGAEALLRAGAEYRLRKELGLRIGAEQMQSGVGSTYWNYSGGIGLNLGEMKIDYAYYHDALVADNSSHFISVSIGFPGVASVRESKRAVEPEVVEEASIEAQSLVVSPEPAARTGQLIVATPEKGTAPEQPTGTRLSEHRVREYINLLDRKIKVYKSQKNAFKVKEVQAEKQRALKRWEAEKKAAAEEKPEKKPPAEKDQLTEEKVRDYIILLDTKINHYRSQKNAAKVGEVQAEKQKMIKRWEEFKIRTSP